MFYIKPRKCVLLVLAILILASSWLYLCKKPSVSNWQVVNNNRTMETTRGYILPYIKTIESIQVSKDYYYKDSLYNRALIDLSVNKGIDRLGLEKSMLVIHRKYPKLARQAVLIETVNFKNRNAFVITYINNRESGPTVIIIDRKTYKILFMDSSM